MSIRRWNPALTPPHWGGVVALVTVWWLSELIGTTMRYAGNQSVPPFYFFLSSLPIIPVVSLVTWLALRFYPGSVTLWHWQKARPYWSTLWTLVAGWLVYETVSSGRAFAAGRWIDQANAGIFVYLVLVFRAILAARPRRKP